MARFPFALLATLTLAFGIAFAASPSGTAGTLSPSAVETVVVSAQRPNGPGVSDNGTGYYSVTSEDILALPTGANTLMTDVLAQMPGVAIDQNQQIHIRDTEGPQFQYQINGVLVPLDINTNPPFISMINPQFVKRLDLLAGVLPARYSYATGGVVSITTKDGCEDPGGSVTLFGGQRGAFEPSIEYGGCNGNFSYYTNALYERANTAFSPATPGPNAIHDWTNQGQGFGFLRYAIDPDTKLSVVLSAAGSDNQLPNVGGLAPQFLLAGATTPPSSAINSHLNFRDALAIVSLEGSIGNDISYQLAYSAHAISENFLPDNTGELIYQGVASTASHNDRDNTLEGDFGFNAGDHDVTAGFYLGSYSVFFKDNSLVFPIDPLTQNVGDVPVRVADEARADNILGGLFVNDLWEINDRLRLNIGIRWDTLTGFTHRNQVDPTANFSFLPTPETTVHGGFARAMQVPSFLGISPNIASTFANTTGEGPNGIATPTTEDDYVWDVGLAHNFTPAITLSEDNYYEITEHYLDTGQFGVVPIFAPFNYGHGHIWGSELALSYRTQSFSAYASLTAGRNTQEGVTTGQFNFDPDELAFIDSHAIVLDHQPLVEFAAGGTCRWHDFGFSLDSVYSSGLRGGFADEQHLPATFQLNASVEHSFDISGVGPIVNRLVFLNVLDRVNLIRPADGIGIFQSAYGSRFTVFDALTIPL